MRARTVYINELTNTEHTTMEACVKSYEESAINKIGEHIVDKMKLPFGINPVKIAEAILNHMPEVTTEVTEYYKARERYEEYINDDPFES